MKIRHLQLPSGTTEGIPFLIDANLSTEQAVAVFELPDDLREQILLLFASMLPPIGVSNLPCIRVSNLPPISIPILPAEFDGQVATGRSTPGTGH